MSKPALQSPKRRGNNISRNYRSNRPSHSDADLRMRDGYFYLLEGLKMERFNYFEITVNRIIRAEND